MSTPDASGPEGRTRPEDTTDTTRPETLGPGRPVTGDGVVAEAPSTATGRPLDLSKDPDRVSAPGSALPPAGAPVPAAAPSTGPSAVRRLDPSRHPDRYDPTLTEMLGDGAQEEARDGYVWLVGLVSVLVFLAVVAFVVGRLGP